MPCHFAGVFSLPQIADHTLHAHGARALDEQMDARVQLGAEGRLQRFDVGEVAPPRAEPGHALPAQIAEPVQPLDTERLGQVAGVPVELRGLGPQLTHLAEHQPAFPAAMREDLQGGPERAGIGVIAVVEDAHPGRPVIGRESPAHGLHRFEPADRVLDRDPQGLCTGRGSTGVQHVVRPE